MSSEVREYRRLALVLEWTPFVVGSVGIAVGNFLLSILPFLVLGLIYLVGAWYLFKASRPSRWWMITLAHLGAVAYALLLFGIIFKLFDFPNGLELMRASFWVSCLLMIPSIWTYFQQRSLDRWSYRFGLKLFSRLLLIAFFSMYIILVNGGKLLF